jgi:hypothetical protein
MKKILLSVFLIAIVGISFVSAFGGKFMDDETRTTMQDAVENEDYHAWRTLMIEQLTEERFNEMVVRHNERMEGNFEGRGHKGFEKGSCGRF